MLKSIRSEPNSLAWRAWLEAAKESGALLFAPHLLRYEVGHFLARATGWDAGTRSEAQAQLLQAVAFGDGEEAHAFAPPLTFSDASYLVLAKALRATLVTYDGVLSKAAKRAGVTVLTPS